MITGNEAALKVREHFENVHGKMSVLNFIIMDMKKNVNENCWNITCSFFPGYSAREPLTYSVKVDFEDGSIIEQEMIA